MKTRLQIASSMRKDQYYRPSRCVLAITGLSACLGQCSPSPPAQEDTTSTTTMTFDPTNASDSETSISTDLDIPTNPNTNSAEVHSLDPSQPWGPCPDTIEDVLWCRLFDSGGLEPANDAGRAIAISSFGQLYLLGTSQGRLWLARAQATNGLGAWEHFHHVSERYPAYGVDIVAMPNGEVVVIGEEEYGVDSEGQGYGGIYIARHDQEGQRLWKNTYYPQKQPRFASATAIGIYPSGDILGLGQQEVGDHSQMVLRRLTSSGEELWTKFNDIEGQSTSAGDVVVAPSGDFYVAGTARNLAAENRTNICLSKFSSDGLLEWFKFVDNPNGLDRGAGVALAPNGDVIVVGRFRAADDKYQAWVRRYSAEGETIWTQIFGETDTHTHAHDVAIDSTGDLVIVGSADLDPYGSRAWIRKLGPEGDEKWSRSYTSPSEAVQATAFFSGVTTDAQNIVYAFGSMEVDGEGWNHFLVALGP